MFLYKKYNINFDIGNCVENSHRLITVFKPLKAIAISFLSSLNVKVIFPFDIHY